MDKVELKLELSKIKLYTGLSEFESKGKLLCSQDIAHWIRSRNKLIGWTYNFNVTAGLIEHFDRLIACQGRPSKRIRIANNTHMKCYIDKDSMLVTSFNLTHATINDLGIEVKDYSLCQYMKRLFEKHWKELE